MAGLWAYSKGSSSTSALLPIFTLLNFEDTFLAASLSKRTRRDVDLLEEQGKHLMPGLQKSPRLKLIVIQARICSVFKLFTKTVDTVYPRWVYCH